MTAAPVPLPSRPHDGHKGTFGRVLIIAGSRGMSGACALSAIAALRGGAGLVFVACPVGIQAIVAGYEPGYLTIGLPEDSDGRLTSDALMTLREQASNCDAIAIGPGLGQSAAVRTIAQSFWQEATVPLVIDADALNVLAVDFRSGSIPFAAGPRVLTPHPGEFARISESAPAISTAARSRVAREFAVRHQVTLVLKGAGSIVTDGDRCETNQTGNAGMATGGSGDVLTGLTAALLAQRMPVFDAVRLAVHLHGLAGDLAAADLTQPGMIASDLPRYLPAAWKSVLQSDVGR